MSVKQKNRFAVKNLVLAAMFVAMGLLLPFLTAQVPSYGKMLLPMHIPILLCGFICGPYYGALAGIITPILRGFVFSMPALMPDGLAMAFELCAYGFFAGMFYMMFTKKGYVFMVYVDLILAMILGRIMWGGAMLVILGIGGSTFTYSAFIGGAVLNAWPGIVLQLVIIPPLLTLLRRAKYI